MEAFPIRVLYAVINVFGIDWIIPAIISRETPLPIPLFVIWSPNHNNKAVPAVSIIVVFNITKDDEFPKNATLNA